MSQVIRPKYSISFWRQLPFNGQLPASGQLHKRVLALRTHTGETCLQKLQIRVFTSRCSPHQQYDIYIYTHTHTHTTHTHTHTHTQ